MQIVCEGCGKTLDKVNYTSTGKKLYSTIRDRYEEDGSWSAGELEFECPYCGRVLNGQLTDEQMEGLL